MNSHTQVIYDWILRTESRAFFAEAGTEEGFRARVLSYFHPHTRPGVPADHLIRAGLDAVEWAHLREELTR